VLHACTYAAFAVLALSFLLDVGVSRGALILEWGIACLFVGGHRFFFRRLVFRLRRSGRLVRRALIAGTDEHAIAIARQLSNDTAGWRVLGFLDDYRPVGTEVTDGLRVVGDPSAAVQLARSFGASDLILLPHAVSWEAQRDLLELAASCDEPVIRLAPGLYQLLAAGTRPMEANFVPLLTLERLRITGPDAVMKAALDYGVALAAMPLVGGMLALLWVASRFSGGGPVLLRRRALGLRGRPFHLLVPARPQGPEPQRGLRRQPWRLQQALASGRLGKLPNVLNILAGRMSLVGPRALTASADLLQQPWTRTLILVRPGLTGPGIADGDGWALDEQAIRDVAYVREYSLWMDLRLLFASLLRALRRERALPAAYQPSLGEEALVAEAAAR
jgi:lipopolysaccharide/colanic/teichoic acid biosynthesis glycosyltransferase